MRKAFIVFLVAFYCAPALAQNLAIGDWQVHLPYNNTISVAKTNNLIYCASNEGLFSFDLNDNSIQRLSKTNGLSEVSVSTIEYNTTESALLVAYTNANIDLLIGNNIVNLSDIKRKSITGSKTIHRVTMRDELAYLACGFGIVVININKREVKDTYIIGPGGTNINVYDISFDQDYIYASTERALYRADINSPSLNDFQVWEEIKLAASGYEFNLLEYFNNRLFVNYSDGLVSNDFSNDSILIYNPSTGLFDSAFSNNLNANKAFEINNNNLIITNYFSVSTYNNMLQRIAIAGSAGDYTPARPEDAFIDENNITWIADDNKGLVKFSDQYHIEFIVPNGPTEINANNASYADGKIWVTHGPETGNLFFPPALSNYENGTWVTYDASDIIYPPGINTNIWDLRDVAIDPTNSDKIFVGTTGRGILEMINNQIIEQYNDTNSSLEVCTFCLPTYRVFASFLEFDKHGNLWVANANANSAIAVRKSDGNWKSFSFPSLASGVFLGDIIIDGFDQKWVLIPFTGFLVFSDNGTIDDLTDDEAKKLTIATGNGGLHTQSVNALVVDNEGEVWVGTNEGVTVFFSPGSIFGGSNFDAQRITIDLDGVTKFLLENEIVTSIAVDGANRKWFGTASAGVFLTNEDGTEQLANFNTGNSPLLSDKIIDIEINDKNGEVFFITDKGIISYRGTATEGNADFSNVTVFPNPATPDYTGLIAINGLVENVDVKITDISGALVFETTAEGGQATWDGNDYNGNRVHTGVYLVFMTDRDGEKTHVAKMVVIH